MIWGFRRRGCVEVVSELEEDLGVQTGGDNFASYLQTISANCVEYRVRSKRTTRTMLCTSLGSTRSMITLPLIFCLPRKMGRLSADAALLRTLSINHGAAPCCDGRE